MGSYLLSAPLHIPLSVPSLSRAVKREHSCALWKTAVAAFYEVGFGWKTAVAAFYEVGFSSRLCTTVLGIITV